MNYVEPKIRSPLKSHGGKSYLARRIIERFPQGVLHVVEPFARGASVGLNLPHDVAYTWNDIDEDHFRFWKTLQASDQLITLAQSVTYGHAAFDVAQVAPNTALTFFIRNRMSRGGLGKDFSESSRQRGGTDEGINAWVTMVFDELPVIRQKIQGWTFKNLDAFDLIHQVGMNSNTLIYCDPPYPTEVRTAKSVYKHEMTDAKHQEFLHLTAACRCYVAISGYRCRMYDDALIGWHRVDWEIANHSGQGVVKERRVESLWYNW